MQPQEYLMLIDGEWVPASSGEWSEVVSPHDGRVIEEVWKLYARVHERTGGRATLLEWDANIPKFSVLQQEVRKAARFRSGARRVAA